MSAGFRIARACAVLGTALLFSSSVRAAECPDPVSEEALAKGKEAYLAHEYADARERFRLAAPCGSVALLFEAQALMRLGSYAEAVALLRAYLKSGADDQAMLEPVRELAARLERENTGQLVVTVNESGASIHVGRFAAGSSPLLAPLIVNAGEYDVRVEKAGFTPVAEHVQVDAGTTRVLNIDLSVSPAAEPPKPPAKPGSAPAPHQDSPGGDRHASGGRMLPVYLAGGATVVALGVGSFFGVKASSTWKDATTRCPEQRCAGPNDLDLDDRAGRYADAATISFVVAGAALATTVTLLLLH